LVLLFVSPTCYGWETPDYVPLTRLKAEPAKYVDKAIITAGVLTVSDFYPKDYPQRVYLSFLLSEVANEGKLRGTMSGETAYLFLNRVYGEEMIKALLKKGENGEPILCMVYGMLDHTKYTSTDWDELEFVAVGLWNSERKAFDPTLNINVSPEKQAQVRDLMRPFTGFSVEKWVDRGHNVVKGRFVSLENGIVTIETETGIVRVPYDRLAFNSQLRVQSCVELLERLKKEE
jgi:hypothetical protein